MNPIPLYPSFAEWPGAYNLAAADNDAGFEVHCTVPDPPPLRKHTDFQESESWDVFEATLQVVRKYGRANDHDAEPGTADERDRFFVRDENWIGDRTQSIDCIGAYNFTPGLIGDLQALLRTRYPLWRFVLTADMDDDLIIVYPDAVRNDDAVAGESLDETCRRVGEHHQTYEARCNRYRPQFVTDISSIPAFPALKEAKVRYNMFVPEGVQTDEAYWNSVPNPPDIAPNETAELQELLCRTLGRHGSVSTSTRESEWSKSRHDMYWIVSHATIGCDRTRIVVNYGTLFFTVPVIRDIQTYVLRKFPLWRIMLDAAEQRDVLVVYPDMVRNDDAMPDEPLEATAGRVADQYQKRRRTIVPKP